VAYFPLEGSTHGLLAISHGSGPSGGPPEGGDKLPLSPGVSVLEVKLERGQWAMVQASPYARRVHLGTPITLAGPAAGHPLLKTAADPAGLTALGSIGNGPATPTPWGTYLSGERDFASAFTTSDQPTTHERRYGLGRTPALNWHELDGRFDTVRHPNEPNRHGWILEIDPSHPDARPLKRTALGRGAHGAIAVARQADGRAVVYRGEWGLEEHLYKFVSRQAVAQGPTNAEAARLNQGLLDDGSLYAARLDADGSGRWLPLVPGQPPLDADAGFSDAGRIAIHTRQAADRLGASRVGSCLAMACGPGSEGLVLALSPGPGLTGSRLIRLQEGAEPDRFTWNLWPAPENSSLSPENLAFDARGRLWLSAELTTDGPLALSRPNRPRGAGAALLACDSPGSPARRFMAAPAGGKSGGLCWTPDGRTMFLNLRTGTLAIRRGDGGPIGS
jgi:secreted PhoX family phosphatase